MRFLRKWRRRAVAFCISAAVTELILRVWGPAPLLIGLLVVSLAGWGLQQIGIRRARKADQLLSEFWGYFKGIILGALFPAAFPGLRALLSGDYRAAFAYLLPVVVVAAIVLDLFGRLPASWTDMFRTLRPRAQRRRGPARRRRSR